jgi:hypothetical protein
VHLRAPTLSRPPHPAPNVRDDREAPLLWARDGAGSKDVSIGVRNDLFLRRGLDTPNQLEFAEQINFYVKSNSRLAGSMREAIAAADLSVIIGRAFARSVGSTCPTDQLQISRKLEFLNYKRSLAGLFFFAKSPHILWA